GTYKGRLRLYLVELPGRHVEDEAARRDVLGDERAVLDAPQRLPHVGFEVGERLGRPGRFDAGLFLDRAFEVVVGEGEHPAVGVVNQDDLLRPQQTLADRQRPDDV